MLHRHPFAELPLEPQDHLRGEADLGHQHQRLAAQLQAPLDELQKHQGLAAARHTVQQGRVGCVIFQLGQQGLVGQLLLAGEPEHDQYGYEQALPA